METAGDIIKDALTEITVLGAEAPVEASDMQTGIRYLNRMMAALDADGIDLGYTVVSDMGDNVTIPVGGYEAIVPMLAARLWTQYGDGAPAPQSLFVRAAMGKETLRALTFTIGASEFPPTLPIGSGNREYPNQTKYYPDLQDDILAESSGSIGLEGSTS